jgi:exosome complex component RRP46
MRFLFAGVTLGVQEKGGGIVLEPEDGDKGIIARITFVYDSVNMDVLASHLEGKIPEKKFQECLAAGKEASLRIFAFYRETIRRKFTKELS